MSHLMIFGAGYSGKAIARALQTDMDRISGTTRGEDKISTLQCRAIAPFIFTGEAISDELRTELRGVTHLVQSIAPSASGDPLLRLCKGDLKSLMPDLQWAAYLSTVGVYGNHDGDWVDEDTPCRPVSVRSVERVEAEQAWDTACQQAGVKLCTLRLSGIYGPGRNGLINLEKGTARRLVKKEQVFNRIRVEDIGAATEFLIEHQAHGIFNVTDDEPAPPQDVVAFAADLMDVEPPEEQPFETAQLSEMARSFYGENKRVSNRKLKELGFTFAYPNYSQSLRQMWDESIWRDE
ncbi:SDR family oxidoreductase [Agrobacterium sp. rho-8.1]|nr:SDR family oxidoreductase [Agrobacterium sp. rho-8.1]